MSSIVTHLDYVRATSYALERLARELNPALVYHSLEHTRDDVLPAIERLAALQGLRGEPLLLLRTAACYHDIGFVVQRADHEAVGATIAKAALPHFGYRSQQIEQIVGMIMATRLPQSSQTPFEQLLADADLDVLGRPDFLARNALLRNELEAFGTVCTVAQWYANQLAFLGAHRYWTGTAQRLRELQKQRNIAALQALLIATATG